MNDTNENPFGLKFNPDGSFEVVVRGINRSCTPLEAFKVFIHHRKFLNETIINGVPLGTEEEVTLHFFPIKKRMTCAEYVAALESRGLKPDPMAQATWNEQNPAFVDKYPNSTQWKNEAGKFCYAVWGWSGDPERIVGVEEENGRGWCDFWFACGQASRTMVLDSVTS